MSIPNEEEEVVIEGEELAGDPLALSYRCTVCYDEFMEHELEQTKSNCPSCGEVDCIVEK